MTNIEMGKHYQTRDGRKVRLYAVDGDSNYPVHGAVLYNGGWVAETWTDHGINIKGDVNFSDDTGTDIIIAPLSPRTMWVNEYPGGLGNACSTKAEADGMSATSRIACHKFTVSADTNVLGKGGE